MMGTILEEHATANNSHKPPAKNRQSTKHQWKNGAPTKQSKHGVPNGSLRESKIPVPENGYQPKRRGKPDRPQQMDTPSSTQRQLNSKTRPQLPSQWEMRERTLKQTSHSKNNKEASHRGAGRGHGHVSQCLSHASERRRDGSRERRPQSLDRIWTSKDSDSASDLSDTERAPAPSTPSTPPNLNLRAEVIDPAEFQRPRGIPQRQRPRPQHCQFSKSYPDFLPPPFNTWSLQQLAVFLNTEGKDVPRPRPVDQLERYLERLLKLEWHQIQTIQDEKEGDGGIGATVRRSGHCSTGRHRPHSTPSANLSTPKSILQCQRAFPLALLSSITNPMPVQQVGCACPHCRARYPHCNGSCRMNAFHQSSRLSPLMERRGRATEKRLPKRSSSESRAQVSEPSFPSRGFNKAGSFNGSSHLRRMQATGNIRNPSLSPPRFQPARSVCSPAVAGAGAGAEARAGAGAGAEAEARVGAGAGKEKDPNNGADTIEKKEEREGRRGRDVSQRRRALSERRRVLSSVRNWDLKVDVLAAEHAAKLKDLVSGKSTGRKKRVDFNT